MQGSIFSLWLVFWYPFPADNCIIRQEDYFLLWSHLLIWLHTKSLYNEAGDFAKNPQISLLKIMHPEILVVLNIHEHVYKNIHWIIFVTTSNSGFNSRKQMYICEIKIQEYHYVNHCTWRFAYHTSNHNYYEYKFVYYINTNVAAPNTHQTTTTKWLV